MLCLGSCLIEHDYEELWSMPGTLSRVPALSRVGNAGGLIWLENSKYILRTSSVEIPILGWMPINENRPSQGQQP